MAQVVNKDRSLVNGYLTAKGLSILGFVTAAISFILCLVFLITDSLVWFGIFFMLSAGGIVLGSIMIRRSEILGSGVEGEGRMIGLIEQLPDPFTGFQNVTVTYDGKSSELDMVVIGLTGIFVIEVKNHGGTIVGNTADRNWVQHKVGQGGTPYSNEFYSPIKQVGTHVYRLANYLRQRGVKVHVESIVYFANPETTVQLYGEQPETAVFCAAYNGAEGLRNHILNREETVSKEDLVRAFMILDGRSQAETEWAIREVNRPLSDEEQTCYNRSGYVKAEPAPTAQPTQYASPYVAQPVIQPTAQPTVAPATAPARPNFCHSCGNRLGIADNFCQKCGKKIF